ncbi:MAG: hypothetical protein N3I35_12980 [Clostridia bacterium]|nr:hypothetical protein [Clostridia bacterium]
MNRVERFKVERKFRLKCTLLIVLFLILILTGICVSDYSINTLMKNEKKISLITVKQEGSFNMSVSIMNIAIHLDTSYFSKDLKKIKEKLKEIR